MADVEGIGEAPLLIVRASMTALRRPGALLDELAGRPALGLLLERLRPFVEGTAATPVVLTTDLAADDPVASLAEGARWRVVRGPVDDVLAGMAIALVRFPTDAVVVVGAEGPLVDPHLVRAALELHRSSGVDHTSNLLPRSYPRGLDVEILGAGALRRAELEVPAGEDRRRPFAHVRRHPERFRLATLASGHDLAREDWTLEGPDGIEALRDLVGQHPAPVATSWNRIVAVGGRMHRPQPGEVHLVPRPPPEPGSTPWVQGWDAVLDGAAIGTVEVAVEDGHSTPHVAVDAAHAEDARTALYRLLTVDAPVPR